MAPSHPPTLDSLARAAQSGGDAELQALLAASRPPLARFLRTRIPESELDDVVQETLIRLSDHLDRYDPDRPFATWLFTIGKRLAINHAQASRRRDALKAEVEHDRAAQVESQQELGSDIWNVAERTLSPAMYRGLWLRYAQGMTVKEVAAEMGRTVVSTKVMLMRARRKLGAEVSK